MGKQQRRIAMCCNLSSASLKSEKDLITGLWNRFVSFHNLAWEMWNAYWKGQIHPPLHTLTYTYTHTCTLTHTQTQTASISPVTLQDRTVCDLSQPVLDEWGSQPDCMLGLEQGWEEQLLLAIKSACAVLKGSIEVSCGGTVQSHRKIIHDTAVFTASCLAVRSACSLSQQQHEDEGAVSAAGPGLEERTGSAGPGLRLRSAFTF